MAKYRILETDKPLPEFIEEPATMFGYDSFNNMYSLSIGNLRILLTPMEQLIMINIWKNLNEKG